MATTRKKTVKKSGERATAAAKKKKSASSRPTEPKAAAVRAKKASSRTSVSKPAVKASKAIPASQKVALAVAEAALDKKAVNVEIIDVAGKVDYSDYVVVMSGTSDRHVSALSRGIAEDVEKKTKSKCTGIEGMPSGAWVLMDFGDVVVHIFHQDVRGYYDLESLWVDAARVPVSSSSS